MHTSLISKVDIIGTGALGRVSKEQQAIFNTPSLKTPLMRQHIQGWLIAPTALVFGALCHQERDAERPRNWQRRGFPLTNRFRKATHHWVLVCFFTASISLAPSESSSVLSI